MLQVLLIMVLWISFNSLVTFFPRKNTKYIIRNKINRSTLRSNKCEKFDDFNEKVIYLRHTELIVLGSLPSGRKVAISMVQWIINTAHRVIFELCGVKHDSIFDFEIPLKQSKELQRLAKHSTLLHPNEWEWFDNK